MEFDVKAIKAQAIAEINEERRRALVDAEKQRMLTKRSLFSKLFPFTITITRRK